MENLITGSDSHNYGVNLLRLENVLTTHKHRYQKNKEEVPSSVTIFNLNKTFIYFGRYRPSPEGDQHFKGNTLQV
jgi:hypothetical protein